MDEELLTQLRMRLGFGPHFERVQRITRISSNMRQGAGVSVEVFDRMTSGVLNFSLRNRIREGLVSSGTWRVWV